MQTKWLYGSFFSKPAGRTLVQKIFMASILMALLVALLPASGAFAAPAGDEKIYGDLELEWSNKLRNWKGESLFYAQVRIFPADFKDKDELARAHELLNKYASTLKLANEVIVKHTGFDQDGHILNDAQADQSVKDLAMYLHTLRALRTKIEEAGFPLHRVR